jgi:hypothetical protein
LLLFSRKVKSLTDKEIILLKKAGITGRVQNPGLCFVYFFLSFPTESDQRVAPRGASGGLHFLADKIKVR